MQKFANKKLLVLASDYNVIDPRSVCCSNSDFISEFNLVLRSTVADLVS